MISGITFIMILKVRTAYYELLIFIYMYAYIVVGKSFVYNCFIKTKPINFVAN